LILSPVFSLRSKKLKKILAGTHENTEEGK